jgi:hypothetical protein
VRQLHDPLWDYDVDGQSVQYHRANSIGTAFPLRAGYHAVTMTYRPLARSLYGGATGLLQLALVILVIGAFRKRGKRP